MFLFIMITLFVFMRGKRRHYHSSTTSFAPSNSHQNKNTTFQSQICSLTSVEGQSSYFGAQLFSYKELLHATTSFDSSKELGKGGFSTVYYGKLQDGREVAIKRLYEKHNKQVTQFMNELEILTRLDHKNLVKLYGCTTRQSPELLLVYEYIPNGTIADHLHGIQSNQTTLPWPIRLRIAIETAQALVYLHASDIIHRDVKSKNILITDNFTVKVADFGLSRLFPLDVSHVSTTPQGSPGYVDPEYHQCYHLTNKSDVYSFGVVLAELISAKPAVDITRNRQEINLSSLAINKILQHAWDEFIDPNLRFQEENSKLKDEVISVADLTYQCLQATSSTRPSMEQVLISLKKIQGEENMEVVDVTKVDAAILKEYDSLSSSDNGEIKCEVIVHKAESTPQGSSSNYKQNASLDQAVIE
ncbi:LEAF RUST 10 DISEASE-RESISTANCE LOCUS RECEPTOR-LIKE PROTEIN KINASE-like 1.1 [Bienertia sinuspersici]